jgi:hypothetical protein
LSWALAVAYAIEKENRQLKSTKLKLNKTVRESIAIYGDGLRELLHDMGMPEENWDYIWSSDDEEHEEDAELQWFVGWFAGVAETLGVTCEKLITLHEAKPEAKTPAKKKAAKKKTPVKKKAAAKKAPAKKKKTPARKLLPAARRQAA